MKINILSLFPEMFTGPLHESIVGKAIEKTLIEVQVVNFRDYTTNRQKHVDDYPYGGGAGMLLQAQPIFSALDSLEKKDGQLGRVILLDPAGKKFDQSLAEEFSQEKSLTFICGHYEGYDERIRTRITDEASLGDFVMTGGEIAAMAMIDATVRLLPGVLGNQASAPADSFSRGLTGLLEYPQYTRPADFQGLKVPDVLLSGNHQKIAEWRQKAALLRTYQRRPDLLKKIELNSQQHQWLREFSKRVD
ncbi:MAG: tRNA (guanosine(37)-N1)-methyltransferase TrmD [Liquorilactobacillus nagelii]|jgi:tRNA (guanine37-N1)-methyltransferase|uniref:tRNA (guanosine(37)-N1)-methyltransferase TrmD n=1 Tax=Liquorilactobacillus nagelii TaxID=82688 RepID=UPI001CCCD49D|nr:tRNA (guanosine(37)-N1)-methyltransferase TrmD [Liquorilactobacillus nagelii]MCI1634457.1 tRNA (guanosine(37)-N1)-methyltransferase TrmD [Liquorilactobacillus nagelii]MCI1920370.1 tRNA (guanosine(37)-N1)-methyltransferase TrmD [Liquorilactobacillus nagelii]MCI1976014.1 tRNA (guanosine(37)-N1)-methyltransferase TrmD [Liquorilactobacillus nagelii]ULQ49780.1 tRNA (guanosine(37)-N1)-methyltransferase TrmD [Liquorilactobacillus nagelii]